MSNVERNTLVPPLPDGTVTLLFSDIEGSTRLLQRFGPAFAGILETHHRLLREAFAANRGHVVDAPGDGFLAAFARAADAVEAAIRAQKAINEESWPDGASVRVRMGLHTGEPMLAAGRYVGIDVHRAARIAAVAHGGQVLLSNTTWSLVAPGLPAQVEIRDLGEHSLKDIPRAERLWQLKIPGLPSDFPPLRTLAGRVHNFPARLTSLVGREREVQLVKALLARPDVRLLTLTGVGGAGKTRLALKVATEVAHTFADGAWFVDLAPLRDPALVASVIARTIGVQESANRPLVDNLRDHLSTRKVLLVLDNFEQILPAAGLVGDLLDSCPGLRAVVTSRAILKLAGEHDVPVPTLSLPPVGRHTATASDAPPRPSEAVQLFTERAAAVRPGMALTPETMQAIAEICVRLDGLPLAIELAATRIRLFSPRDLLLRLTRRLPILTGGAHDLPSRQQTLRDAIAWSDDLLAPEEQRLFRSLAVFGGGFTPGSVERVCQGAGSGDALDILGSLLEKSLVKRNEDLSDETRFSMLETIREFASEQLERSPEAAALRHRHATYFLELAEAGDHELRGARQTEWLARLEREHDNFRAALIWTLETGGDRALGARLAGSLWWFWSVRGHFSEARGWAVRAIDTAVEVPPAVRASVLRLMANFAFVQGDYVQACSFATDGRKLFQQVGRPVEAAWLQGLEAIAVQYQGNAREARVVLEDALGIVRKEGHAWTLAWMLRNLGRVAHDLGDDAAAASLLEESLQLTRRIGDTRGIALSLQYLGVVALALEPHRSGHYFAESVELFRRIDDRRGLAWALHYLAAAALVRGHGKDAQLFENESFSLRSDLGDKRGIAECLEGHAIRLTFNGDNERAISLFATAAALRGAIGAPGSPADRRRVQLSLDVARAAIEPSAAAEAWRKGCAATIEESASSAVY